MNRANKLSPSSSWARRNARRAPVQRAYLHGRRHDAPIWWWDVIGLEPGGIVYVPGAQRGEDARSATPR